MTVGPSHRSALPDRSRPGLSLWDDSLPSRASRAPLVGDVEADVAVVGGGLTGLWTAYYLLEADPSLRVVVVEARHVGFGASGRNGGWCSALFPAGPEKLASLPGSSRAAALAHLRAMQDTVREVIDVTERHGLDVGAARGGTVVLARSRVQEQRARAEVAHARTWGQGRDDLAWLDGDEARARLAATHVRGGTWTPHCAAVHPGRLVRGVADLVEARGGTLHEDSPATRVEPGLVTTPGGRVRARQVVRATEGYTARLRGHRRDVVPVYSLVLATAPLDAETWARIGLARRETFSDHRHLVIYGQRTADDRLVFGGRGAPYHLGSAIADRFDTSRRVHDGLRATLVEMFPVLAGAEVTHTWGGPLGIPRDWCASVGHDPATGTAWAGGYVGDGLATTNLAGRTLRDLLLGHDTDLVALPWVNHHSPRWEPEPLRWAGVNAGLRVMTWADAEERVTGRPSRLASAMAPLLGH